MARKPKNIGNNASAPPMSEDDAAALQTYYVKKAHDQQVVVDGAAEELKAAKGDYKAITKRVEADLGLSPRAFAKLLEDIAKGPAVLRMERVSQTKLLHRAGIEVGAQQDLFGGDTGDQLAAAYEDGLKCGLAAGDPAPGKHIAAVAHQEWMNGYHAGQERNIMLLQRADAIFEERAAPNFSDDDVVDDAKEPELFDAAAEAKKLVASGFTETPPEEVVQ